MSNILSAVGTGLVAGKLYHLWAPTQLHAAWLIFVVTAVGFYLLTRTQSEES